MANRDERRTVRGTGLGCVMGGLSAAALLFGSLATLAYVVQRELEDLAIGSDLDFPIPDGLSPPVVDTLKGLDAGTGDRRWRHDIAAADLIGAADDVVVLHALDTHDLFTLDARTGKQRWREGAALVHDCGPIVDGSVIVGITFRGELVARDVQTGQRIWHTRAGRIECGALVAAGGTVVASGSEGRRHEPFTAGYDIETGSERWRLEGSDDPGKLLQGSAAGLVFAAVDRGAINAVDAMTGGVRWQWQPPGPIDNDLLFVAVNVRAVPAGTTVGFSTADPEARRRDHRTITVFVGTQDGVERWRTQSGAASMFSYDSTTDTLVELGEPPVPIGRRAATGEVLWTAAVSGAAVTAREGTAYVGDRSVTALDDQTGTVRWTAGQGSPGFTSVVAVTGGAVLGGGERP